MNPPLTQPNSATPRPEPSDIFVPAALSGEEDFAIGCECANPALQIESWGSEATPAH